MSSIVHFELPADDTGRAKAFWGSFLGWKFREMEGPMEYHMTEGIEPVGAIYPAQSGERGPVVYFAVDDMDSALGQVGELGGSVELGKQQIPGVGWFARCQDTEGNRFSLFQADESASG
jgi:predicted enzyme related to lactoylglutathione lyase